MFVKPHSSTLQFRSYIALYYIYFVAYQIKTKIKSQEF